MDRPILFSAPMVRALLDGRKTQTRRVLKPQPYSNGFHFDGRDILCHNDWLPPSAILMDRGKGKNRYTISDLEDGPEGITGVNVGDRMWVRESWSPGYDSDPDGEPSVTIIYRADGAEEWRETSYDTAETWESRYGGDGPDDPIIHSPIFMPRWASRLTLAITDVRVQRLQDISEEDAIAEGATSRLACSGFMSRDQGWSMDWSKLGTPSRYARDGGVVCASDIALGSAKSAFASFINGLHDPKWNHKGDGIFGANPWVAAYTFTVERRNIDALPSGADHG
jgi:hypothetical protein